MTSIDISDNSITDEGLQQLVSALILEDAAPELISLDVSRNRLTNVSKTILVRIPCGVESLVSGCFAS